MEFMLMLMMMLVMIDDVRNQTFKTIFGINNNLSFTIKSFGLRNIPTKWVNQLLFLSINPVWVYM